MISAELKDQIIAILHNTFTESHTTVSFNFPAIAKQLSIRPDEVEIVIEQLGNMELLSITPITNSQTLLSARGEFFDFFNHGAFRGREALAELEIEKLKLEVISLEGSIPGDVTKRLLDRIELVSKFFLIATGLKGS